MGASTPMAGMTIRIGKFAPKAACARAANSGEGGDTSNCPTSAMAVGSSVGKVVGLGVGVVAETQQAASVRVGGGVDAGAGGGSATDPQAARRGERKRKRRRRTPIKTSDSPN